MEAPPRPGRTCSRRYADDGHQQRVKNEFAADAKQTQAGAHADRGEEADHENVAQGHIEVEVDDAVAERDYCDGLDEAAGDGGGNVETVQLWEDPLQPSAEDDAEAGEAEHLNHGDLDSRNHWSPWANPSETSLFPEFIHAGTNGRIHGDDIGLQFGGFLDRFGTVVGDADHLDLGIGFQDLDDSTTEKIGVIHLRVASTPILEP